MNSFYMWSTRSFLSFYLWSTRSILIQWIKMDEEQWDDMAIIRAFEAALSEKKTKKEQSKKPTPR
jgi:hypothetical protein